MLAEWTDPAFAEIANWVHQRTGLALSRHRYPDAEAKIRRALSKTGGLQAAKPPFDAMQLPLDELVAELTVGETYFFRDPDQFRYIRSEILPEHRRRQATPLRAWSAGCASGEEAYSLAILFEEEGVDPRGRVLATDISRPALARAKQAVYGPWSLRGDDGSLAQRYFRERSGKFHLDERIRQRVDTQYLNLALDRYPSLAAGVWGMDLILCRNVLIYFDPETVRRVMRRLIDTLAEGGTLIVGASDPVLQEDGPFEVVVTGAGVFYRRHTRSRPKPVFAAPAPLAPTIEPPATVAAFNPAPRIQDRAAATRLPDPVPEPVADKPAAEDGNLPWQRLKAMADGGDVAGAEIEAARLIAADPLAMPLHFTRAMLLAALDRYADAALALRQALYLDRSLVAAYLALGHVLERMGDLDGARRAYLTGRELAAARKPDEILPFAEGETAGRMLAAADAQLALLASRNGRVAEAGGRR